MSPLVGVIMGSKSDWSTMSHSVEMLEALGIPYEVQVVSAHRTPDLLFSYAEQAHQRGIAVIIAGAGGAAHLPGMCAAKTHLPVLGVPVQSAGAINAALLAASIIGHQHPEFHAALNAYRTKQTQTVLDNPDPREA